MSNLTPGGPPEESAFPLLLQNVCVTINLVKYMKKSNYYWLIPVNIDDYKIDDPLEEIMKNNFYNSYAISEKQ